jgi:hypothetical protein
VKLRLTQQTSKVDGTPLFNVYYKRDQPAYSAIENPWVLLGWFYTEKEARDFITEQMEVPHERFIEEFEVPR